MAKLKSTPTTLDKIRETSPHYADLLDRMRQLLDRADEIKREVGGNTTVWRSALDAGGNIKPQRFEESLGAQFVRNKTFEDDTPRPELKPALVRRAVVAANALLEDLLPPKPPEEPSPPPPPKRWPGQDRYRALSEESDAIHEALRILAPEIERERRSYSKAIAEQRIGEYSARVERAVDAARDLGSALLEIYSFLDQARLDGVERQYFRPVNLRAFDLDINSGNPLRLLIADAVARGHAGAEKLPDWKMPASIELLHL